MIIMENNGCQLSSPSHASWVISWVGDHAQGLHIFLYLFGTGSISVPSQIWQSSGLITLSPDLGVL